MSTLRTIAYVLGGAFLCGIAGVVIVQFPLRGVLPSPALELAQLLVVVGGGYYGYVQSKKTGAPSSP